MKSKKFLLCLTILLLATSCSSETSESEPSTESEKAVSTTTLESTTTTQLETTTTETESETASDPIFAPEGIKWDTCYGTYECGDLQVPLNYSDLNDGLINIALVRISAVSEPYLGPLLINPGGPGGSGVELVGEYGEVWEWAFSNFDVIGFDPRGVG